MMTLIIIIITAIISIMGFYNRELFFKLMFNPYQVHHRKEWHRFITHALVHAGWLHLIVNMYVLYLFGGIAEQFFEHYMGNPGRIFYLVLYLGGVLFATLPSYARHKNNVHYNSVGASGAVSAVLFASIIFAPTNKLMFIFLPIPIPAFLFGIIYLVFEYYMDKRSRDHVAHDAHFWGALFGVGFTLISVPQSFLNFVNQITAYLSSIF